MARVASRYGKPADMNFLAQQMRWFEQLSGLRQLERLSGLLGLQTNVMPLKKSAGAMNYCRYYWS